VLIELSEYLVCLYLNIRQDTALGRQAKLFICILSLENKVDSFRSASQPFQLLLVITKVYNGRPQW
jgi:hypothetical protein